MGSETQIKTWSGAAGARGKTKRKAKVTRCCDCGFQSKRAFNVIRHYERIHGPAKRKLECCGRIFANKGRFYQHCADRHPETRKSSKISSTKYKITSTETKDTARRRSLRLLKPKIENKDLSYFDEDKPPIDFHGDPRPIKMEEIIKLEDYHEFELNCVEILFKGDAKSPLHTKAQQEYLRYIDFDSFKLA